MGIASDLSGIKDVSDTIVANKVSKFCYTDTAYEDNDANGVSVYNVNQEQNIPTSNPSIMKVNETVVTKGWRTRASSITRMFMNHMLGRLSYNVNKLTDMMSSLLTALSASLGTANGVATLDSNGRIPYSQLPESAVELKGYWDADTNTPELADGTGDNGDEYFVSVAGGQDLGSGTQYFKVGDRVVYTGGIWKNIDSGSVRTINTLPADAQGNVTVNMDNGNLWTRKWLLRTFSKTLGTNFKKCEGTHNANGAFYGDAGHIAFAYNDGVYLCKTAPHASGDVIRSTDGIHWEVSLSGVANIYEGAIQYYDGTWYIATTTGLLKSEDKALTWTKIFDGATYCFFYWESKHIYLLGVNDGIYWSEDLSTWTLGSQGGMQLTSIFKANDSLCTISSPNGGDKYSVDGKNWTAYSVSLSSPFSTIYYANGLWFSTGRYPDNMHPYNSIIYSTDGINWNVALRFTDIFPLDGLVYSNGVYTANILGIGDESNLRGGLYQSTDGIHWSKLNTSTTADSSFRLGNIAVYNGCLATCEAHMYPWPSPTNRFLWLSHDSGATWHKIYKSFPPDASSTDANPVGCFYADGKLFVISYDIWYSSIEDALEGYFTE